MSALVEVKRLAGGMEGADAFAPPEILERTE